MLDMSHMPDGIGMKLGNYRLVRLLGQGGFADVHLGEHVYLKTPAAIKVMQMRLVDDALESFLTEARTIAHLEHPHIVRVLEFGIEGTTPFLIMKYAPHGTLRQRYPRKSTLPAGTIVSYVKQIASALQYAHDRGVIHRDIKPENMLLGNNMEILLSDFGLAVIAQSMRSSRNLSDLVHAGTTIYMAPEQFQGKACRASDLYALAVVVYEWFCGVCPFSGSDREIAIQQMYVVAPPLREKMPEIAPAVEEVVLKALSKEPAERFPSVWAFACALENACVEAGLCARDSSIVASHSDPLFLASEETIAYDSRAYRHSREIEMDLIPTVYVPIVQASREISTPSTPLSIWDSANLLPSTASANSLHSRSHQSNKNHPVKRKFIGMVGGLVLAGMAVLLGGIAWQMFAPYSQAASYKQNQVIKSSAPVSSTATPTATPTVTTPTAPAGDVVTIYPTAQTTPYASVNPTPTPTPIVTPTPSPTPLPVSIITAAIPGLVQNHTNIYVPVKTNIAGAVVIMHVDYAGLGNPYTSKAQVTDASGKATLSWYVNVTHSIKKSVTVIVTVIATDSRGKQSVDSATVTVIN